MSTIKANVTALGHYEITSPECTEEQAREISKRVYQSDGKMIGVYYDDKKRFFVNGFERKDAAKLLAQKFPELEFNSYSIRDWGDMSVSFSLKSEEPFNSEVRNYLISLSEKMKCFLIGIDFDGLYHNGTKLQF